MSTFFSSQPSQTSLQVGRPIPSRALVQSLVLSASSIASQSLTSVDDERGRMSFCNFFSNEKTPTKDITAGIVTLPPKEGRLCSHHHPHTEIYYVLKGTGVVTINGIKHPVKKGSAVFIPGGAEHGTINTGEVDLKWLYVFPTGSFENVQYTFTEQMKAKL